MNTVLDAVVRFLSAIAAMLLLGSCSNEYNSFAKALHRSGEAALTATNAVVSVASVTRFEWDTLFIFSPYTSVDQIHSQLGYKWEEAECTGIDWSDTFYLFVFTKGGKVVRHYKFPRNLGDFQNVEDGNSFSKETAIFEVKRATDTSSKRLIFTPRRSG